MPNGELVESVDRFVGCFELGFDAIEMHGSPIESNAEFIVFLNEFDVVFDELFVDGNIRVVGFPDPVLNEGERSEALGVGEVGSVWWNHGELRNGEYLGRTA